MTMRTFPLMALFVGAILLAGCTSPAGTKTAPTSPAPSEKLAPASIKILPALDAKLAGATATGASWIAPGTPITLTATPPTNAVGAVEYLWAIGQVPQTAAVPQKFGPDTGSKTPSAYLQPGQSRAIKFDISGVWQMHCHPHPFMRGNVTVVDGYQDAARQVDVQILDGGPEGYRFFPENVTLAPGSVVVYHNNGTQPHSATWLQQDPPVKKLPLTGKSGTINADGQGWRRIYLYTHDSTGALGTAFYDVYVGTLPTFTSLKFPLDFAAGGAPAEAQAPLLQSFVTNYNGTMWLNYTASDAANAASAGATPNVALVTVKLKDQGANGDGKTSEKKASDKLTTRVGTLLGLGEVWNLAVIPEQGVKITGLLTVEVQYDPVPPPPTPYIDPESAPHHH